MTSEPVRLGVAGLGRAFTLMLPTFRADPRVRLVAAATLREASRAAFAAEFGGRAHANVADLCADPDVEAVYVATPHQLHRAHVDQCIAARKHILVEKPLAVSLADGRHMVEAAHAAGIHLVVGPSHSFDAPVAAARRLIVSDAVGAVRMILAFAYTDFLYRPRRPEELDTAEGGGVLFGQAVHQIDMVRLLAGGLATSVRAMTGAWDPARPAEGAYSALIGFAGGVFASLTYSGYGRFDSDEWQGWIGEHGRPKDPQAYGAARRALAGLTPEEETALKAARTYGNAADPPPASHHEHFGPVIVSCERADIRLTPDGLWICADTERRFEPLPPPAVPRAGVIDALVDAVRENRPPVQDGAWGLASLEICHAILQSAREGVEVAPTLQVPVRDSDEATA